MLVFKFSTLVLVLCVTVCLANKEAFYAEVLKKSLDARTLNLTMARSATMRVTIPSTLQLEFNGMHLLHYMLDLFMRSRNVQQRKEIIDLTVLMIEKGGDVLAVQRNQPDLVLKSIIIRQMKLAKRLAERGAPPELSSALLQMIYSVPCDTVPLAKLLLHADTIVRSDSIRQFICATLFLI
jgi:S-ribosylhomocysteine lyase LuxS involved in autoinducer biosynthesis